MRLILTQEVSGLGTPGDVVEVKDGYGRNYLMPRGLAIAANRGTEKQVATIRRARDVREVRDVGQANEVKKQLEALNVQLSARTGEGGRLFGSVTTADVAEAIVRAGGPSVDRRKIELSGAIKSTGSHAVTVRVHDEVSANLEVDVTPA
ncbi:MAG: 50S ribosomal protein L9 [Geodermatophilaceae bacterium]|jgi:large subunit ribosomal protein L9|nr:50S ribosomal protein L9 [Geodermatophilaceae bacterium]MDQ3466062.1 50S ribosomal protein L9 [Actinomycetota bacterium]